MRTTDIERNSKSALPAQAGIQIYNPIKAGPRRSPGWHILFLYAAFSLTACSNLDQSRVALLRPSQDGAPVVQYGAGVGFGSGGVHTVLSGETIYAIARQYGVAPNDVIAVNDLVVPYHLQPGMRVQLPPPNAYRVKRGDSLALIAKTFSVAQTDLIAVNKLRAPYRLIVGQKLQLPRVENIPNNMAFTVEPAAPLMAVPNAQVQVQTLPPVVETKPMIEGPGVQVASIGSGMMVVPREKPTFTPASVPDAIPVSWPLARDSGRAFFKPVNGQVISNFGRKNDGRVNEGVNIAAPKGTPVRAARDGEVVYVGNAVEGYGNLILMKHDGGYITTYAHMDRTLVKDRARVKRGQVIGTVGSTGNVDRAQLHFEIRKNRKSIDPRGLI
jgi:murein DD-endopeptidase MepM/ murein hydrolase activator NlpD